MECEKKGLQLDAAVPIKHSIWCTLIIETINAYPYKVFVVRRPPVIYNIDIKKSTSFL